MSETTETKATRKPKPAPQPPKSLGSVPSLEEHVRPDWWRFIFNATYLKTDADVVDDQSLTRREVDQILRILPLTPDDHVLDLCCGQGRHTLELARRGFTNLDGLDRSNYLVSRARATAKKESLSVRFKGGDARKLPYPTDTFDAVLILGNSFGYFETAQDDLRVLREVFRVIKPSGRLLIDVTDGDHMREHYDPRSWEWLDKKLLVCRERSLSVDGQRLISREIVTHVEKGVVADQFYAERLYNQQALRDLLKAAGFSDITTQLEFATDSKKNQDLGMMARRIITTGMVRKEWSPRRGKPRPDAAARNVVVVLGDPTKSDVIKPGATFDEDDQYTVDQLTDALRQIEESGEFRFSMLHRHDTLITDLMARREKGHIDLVLNLCDEGFGNDARKELHVPAILEMLNIPYTGGGPQCLAYCYDKSLTRGVAEEMGVPVPDAFFIKPEDTLYDLAIRFPVIVKPNFGDSSFGITQRSVCDRIEQLIAAITEVREKIGYDKGILVEEFLTGADITVGIIGNPPESFTVLPISEEDYSALPEGLPKICGYEAKWLPDSPYWQLKSRPAKLPEATEKFVIDACIKLYERLECRDYARFDWRLDAQGEPHLLEVNPNPGWVWDGHMAKMCSLVDISYAKMLNMILHAALDRFNLVEQQLKPTAPAVGR